MNRRRQLAATTMAAAALMALVLGVVAGWSHAGALLAAGVSALICVFAMQPAWLWRCGLVLLGVAMALPTWPLDTLLPLRTFVFGQPVYVQSLIALLGATALVLHAGRRNRQRSASRATMWLEILATVMVALAAAMAVFGSYSDLPSRVNDAAYLVEYALVPIVVETNLREREARAFTLRVMTVAVLAYSLFAIATFLVPSWRSAVAFGGVSVSGVARVASAGGGISALMVVPLWSMFLYGAWSSVWRRLVLIAMVAAVISVFLSQSRAYAAIMFVIAVAFFLAKKRRSLRYRVGAQRRIQLVVMAFLVLCAVSVAGPAIGSVTSMASRGLPSLSDPSTTNRLVTQRQALRRIMSDVWASEGFGKKVETYSSRGDVVGAYATIDSAILTVGYKGGLLLAAAFLAFLLASVAVTVVAARVTPREGGDLVWIAIACAYAPYALVAALPSSHLVNNPVVPVAVALLLGAVAGQIAWNTPLRQVDVRRS